MKLFLSSLAISDPQSTELAQLVGKDPKDIKLALIENAADTYAEGSRAWVNSNRAAIQSHGFDVEIIDIRKYKGKLPELKDKLISKDVMWFGGGNTYYLRWLLKDIGVEKLIAEFAQKGKVYGGGSAGAIIAGPTLKHFETADDPADAPEVMLDGLHLTDRVVVPHMDNPKFAAIVDDINSKLVEDGFKTAPLRDAQALVIDGDAWRVV
ncbi:MAG TPA: Type 1 glutamine amidotransferase-like domain-containing protein [Candidatus Saccharimonadales bacterium]|nr:Type 1 glutamine amidotransferase-like domain-containing protein [Candidatus Saccharimonadales bacterium]